jgi:dehydrogenase/reductase SDR family member 1
MLQGKVALVTGASRGIGAGVARELAAQGATVILAARTKTAKDAVEWGPGGPPIPGSLDETLAVITRAGGKAEPYPIDLSVTEDIAEMVDQIVAAHGRIDILANCAMGLPSSYKGSIWDTPPEDWQAQIDIGLKAKYMTVRAVSGVMRDQGSGLIANISSGASMDEYYNPMFRIAMSGIDRMTTAIAHDLHPFGVSVVSLWPRWVRTEWVTLAAQLPRPGFEVTNDDLDASDSPEFTGRAIAALAADPKLISRSGRIFPVVQLAHDYGFTDLDGTRPALDEHVRKWMRRLQIIHAALNDDPQMT